MSGAAPLVMPTRILVVGAGGREHALAWKLSGEPGVNEVAVAPGSAAIAREPRVRCLPDVDPLDGPAVVAAARAFAAELVVVGPEAPLAAGVADAVAAAGFAVFGPSAAAARIESSKAFCHEVAAAAGVPMARSGSFSAVEPALALVRSLAGDGRGSVVKADGLAAGKGVTVCDDSATAEAAIRAVLDRDPTVLVEERLTGREASAIALCDGRRAVALPLARDHKRLLDGDAGPNTGGMGAYSPLPDLPDAAVGDLVAGFHVPILAELERRGHAFRGALYAGLILTAGGPVLLECNARFGDPETQVVLPILDADLGELLDAVAHGHLDEVKPIGSKGAAVGVVLASGGYPRAYDTGKVIHGLDEAAKLEGVIVFHAGTARNDTGEIVTAGGRVLTVVGVGQDLAEARDRAYAAADLISFEGMQRREDIALREIASAPAS
jgi:phosphoribosylamine--glycine ligase